MFKFMFKPSEFTKSIALIASVLTVSLFLACFVSAWTEPDSAPPAGNVSTPLNTGPDNQSKEGWLGAGGVFSPQMSLDVRSISGLGALGTTGGAILNTGGAAVGLIVDKGNVGIGTTAPGARLHVSSNAAIGTSIYLENPLNDNIWSLRADGIGAGAYSFHIRDEYADQSRITIDVDGNVGIGTTNPSAGLEVVYDGQTVLRLQRNIAAINSPERVGTLNLKTTGNMVNGFGPTLDYFIEDNAGVNYLIGAIGAVRDTADDKGALVFFAGTSGQQEFMRINKDGNVGIGTASPGAKLDVQGGDIKVGSLVTIKGDGSIVFNPQTSPPSLPVRGQLYFDANSNAFKFYDGSNWQYLDSGYMSGLIDYVDATHTRKQCVDAGGSVTPISGDGTNTEVCKFSGTEISCPSGWTQAANWQRYDPFRWGGDACGRHISNGPSIFSNQIAMKYWECCEGFGCWGAQRFDCDSNPSDWYVSGGVGGAPYTGCLLRSAYSAETNRAEIGCK